MLLRPRPRTGARSRKQLLTELQRALPPHMRQCWVVRRDAFEGSPAARLRVLACAGSDLVAAATEGQRAEAEQVAILVDTAAEGDAVPILPVCRDSAEPAAVHGLPGDR